MSGGGADSISLSLVMGLLAYMEIGTWHSSFTILATAGVSSTATPTVSQYLSSPSMRFDKYLISR